MSNKRTLEQIIAGIRAIVYRGEFAYRKNCLEELLEELDLAKEYAISEFNVAQEYDGFEG